MIEAYAFVMVKLPRPHKIHCVPPLGSIIAHMGGVTGYRCWDDLRAYHRVRFISVVSTDSRKWY